MTDAIISAAERRFGGRGPTAPPIETAARRRRELLHHGLICTLTAVGAALRTPAKVYSIIGSLPGLTKRRAAQRVEDQTRRLDNPAHSEPRTARLTVADNVIHLPARPNPVRGR
jgi:hypothetical protein